MAKRVQVKVPDRNNYPGFTSNQIGQDLDRSLEDWKSIQAGIIARRMMLAAKPCILAAMRSIMFLVSGATEGK